MSAVSQEVRILLDDPEEGGSELALLGVVLGDDAIDGRFFRDLEAVEGSGREGLLAPHTALLVSRRFLVTARARERGEFVRLLGVDVESVHGGIGVLVGLVAEAGEVTRRVLAPSRPTLTILDPSLTHSLLDEPARVRLSEVRRRDGLRETCAFRRQLEHVQIGDVGHLFWLAELAPEQVAIVAGWVVVEPRLQIGRRDDQVDGPAASLALDLDAHRVLAIEEVADAERLELATTEAGLELDGDRGGVARVATLVDHREDVRIPLEHVLLGRHRIVVPRGARRYPGDRLRRLVESKGALTEDADRAPVVTVRLLVVVLAIDPAEDLLGGLAVLEGVGESTSRLGHPRTVAKEFQVPVIGVFGVQEIELVTESEQRITVLLSQVPIVVFDSLAQGIKFHTWIAHTKSLQPKTVNIVYTSRPWLLTNSLQSRTGTCTDSRSGGAETASFRQPTAFDKAHNGLWRVDAPQSRCSA